MTLVTPHLLLANFSNDELLQQQLLNIKTKEVSMSQTVIGFFDDQSEAQKAVEQLQSRGISRDRIDISRGSTGTGNTSSSTASSSDVNPVSGSERDENTVRRTSDDRTVDPEGRNTNVFTDFFNNLFGGSDDKDSERYSHVASRAEAIVTVHAGSSEEAEDAAKIMDDCGAVDVDERATKYGYSSPGSSGGLGGGTNLSDNSSASQSTGSAGMRSRIFDRRLDDNMRLGSSGMNNDLGQNTSSRDNTVL